MIKKHTKIINQIFVSVEAESAAAKLKINNSKPDKKVFIVAIVAAVSLVFIEYLGKEPGYSLFIDFCNNIGLNSFSNFLTKYLEHSGNIQLNRLAYWVSIILIFYIAVPVIIIKFVFKEKLRDYGFSFLNFRKDIKIYFFMLVFMIPLVYMMSRTQSFQSRYPFYSLQQGESLFPYFWIWQFLYFFQFIGVEFFFRGFMLHGTKRQLGFYSILFMVIPYCMIHFGKPMPETFAAIIAGVALGILSLKSKSIIPGILIHYSVAIAMDFAALYQKGYF